MKHLENIFQVCKRTSGTRHWMPTREAQFLKQLDPATIPTNLIIRMSSHMIDQGPVKFWPWTSTVTSQASVHARPQNRATVAAAADSAGTERHQTCVTVNINDIQITQNIKSQQAALRCQIQGRKLTSSQASSDKHPSRSAQGVKLQARSNKLQDPKIQGTSDKTQA